MRSFITLCLLGLAGAIGAATPKPNIVYIISDDHRWDCIGAAGNANVHTPNLDKLAKEGVHFKQATMHVPQCSPGRAQVLTGLSPHQNGWLSNDTQRPEVDQPDGFSKYKLVPAMLRDSGYDTVLVGKWHLAPDPWNCGFSSILTWMPPGGGPYKNPKLAYGSTRETTTSEGFTQEILGKDAASYISSRNRDSKPSFLWLALTAPHAPFKPNPEHIEQRYKGKSREELLPPGFKGMKQRAGKWNDYYAAITTADEQVGRVMQAIEQAKLQENTVVVFCGDNGFMMGNRDWDGKVLPYEGAARVPMIIKAPGLQKFTGVTDACASSLDLSPTFLQLAGISPPENWTGRNLIPALQRKTGHGIDYAICEFPDSTGKKFLGYAYRAIRTPTHKLIVWEETEKDNEFYNLKDDAQEKKNLAETPEAAKMMEELRANLKAWMQETNDPLLELKPDL